MDSKELFDFKSIDWITVLKVSAVFTASTLPKIRSFFSDYRARTRLKNDIELIKLASETSVDTSLVKARVEKNMQVLYAANKKPLFSSTENVISGLIWIICFGWWTVSLYQQNNEFNPWMIVTALVAALGLSGIFHTDGVKKKQPILKSRRVPEFSFIVLSWRSVLLTLAPLVVSVWVAIALYNKSGPSWWHILLVLVACGCLLNFGNHFDIKTRSDFNPEDYLK